MGIYSYHTFVLPFIWEGHSGHRLNMKEFSAFFDENPNWEFTNMPDESVIDLTSDIIDNEDALTYYQEYQYFHPYVRKAIYGFDSSIIKNYSFVPQKLRNKGHYYIEKTFKVNGEPVHRIYDLLISGIKLKIFNTGVALFILECENHGVDAEGKRQDNFDDVKNINDYGRRISLPYIPTANDGYSSLCADKLTVEIEGVGTFVDDYIGYAKKLNEKEDITNDISLVHMCDYIKQILGYGSSKEFTSRKTNDKSKIYIYPALDDRMFVACCTMDKNVANLVAKQDGDSYKYLTDDSVQKQLYEYAFVDLGYDNCSCQTHGMRKKLLEEHVYDRWADYGTIDSVSTQGFMRLMNSTASFLVNPFLTQYVQMACLSLVQRATLIHFQREASHLSANIEELGKKIKRKTILDLMNFQERFVAYQSQLSFTEVTPQEQGIELYAMLQKFMFINQETNSLQSRIENLEDAANTNLDFGFNKIALVFTVVSLILAIADILIQLFFSIKKGVLDLGVFTLRGSYFGISLLLLSFGLCFGILFNYRRRK